MELKKVGRIVILKEFNKVLLKSGVKSEKGTHFIRYWKGWPEFNKVLLKSEVKSVKKILSWKFENFKIFHGKKRGSVMKSFSHHVSVGAKIRWHPTKYQTKNQIPPGTTGTQHLLPPDT